MPKPERPVSKKKKFIKDGIFYAEIDDLFSRELAECGYAGCEVRVTPTRTEVIIRATKTQNVVGPQGRNIRELTALVQKKFKFPIGGVMLYAEKVLNKGLSALAQAEAVRYRLKEGLSVRRACYSVLRFIMDSEAKGCEICISGKLRGQRAKMMKFREGYMIHAGDPVHYYVDRAVKHVHLRQGVIGVIVKIMLPNDPEKGGPKKQMPDVVIVNDPKDLDDTNDKGLSQKIQSQVSEQQQTQQSQQPSQQAPEEPQGQFQNQQEQQGQEDFQGGFNTGQEADQQQQQGFDDQGQPFGHFQQEQYQEPQQQQQFDQGYYDYQQQDQGQFQYGYQGSDYRS